MTQKIFDLKTLVERDWIEIDDDKIEVRSLEEFGLEDVQLFQQSYANISRMAGKGDDGLTKADSKQMIKMIDRCVRSILVDPPEDVMAKLTQRHKMAILNSFTEAVSRRRKEMEAAAEAELEEVNRRLLGENSSPNSSDSTEETR